MNYKVFDVLSEPCIHKSLFLEASAGTGKTFALEHLYLRLLIESHENKPALELEEILVLTFTNASTRELKFRIKQKIKQSIELISRPTSCELPEYLTWLESSTAKKEALNKLKRALFSFNQAQIFTLHAFCQQALQEAPSSLGLFHPKIDEAYKKKLELIVNDTLCFLLKEKEFHPSQMEALMKSFKGDIRKLKRQLVEDANPNIPIVNYPCFQSCLNEISETVKAFQNSSFFSSIQSDLENFSKLFKGNYSSKEGKLKDKVTDSSETFYQVTTSQPIGDNLEKILFFLELHDPEKVLKKHHNYILGEAKDYAIFHKKLLPLLQEILSPEITYLRILKLVLDTWKEYSKTEHLFSPDELLNSTRKALSEQSFTAFLTKKYKAICIDEFQDTDPIQWEIFSTLFPPHSHQLYLVGDPKQSIYAFRQADLYTFIEAGNKLGENTKALLNTNYRSTSSLTAALNAFFCDDFTHKLFKLPVQNSCIPYHKVSSPQQEQVEASTPMKLWLFSPNESEQAKVSVNTIENNLLFPRLVNEIQHLFLKEEVALDSIAILVKDRYQASEVQSILKQNHIPSHTQQSKKVYESPIFFCISELLQVCFSPNNLSLLKICLGNEFFQIDPEILRDLEQHSSLPEFINLFVKLQQTLKSEGIAAFLSLLNRTICPITNSTIEKALLSLPDKDLLYEDFMTIQKSLLEFEGQAIKSFSKYEDLLLSFHRFLKEEELNPSNNKVEKSGSVHILTLHMSKGLEFDYVFPIGITKRHKNQPLTFYLNHPNYRVKKAAIDSDPSLQLFHEEQNAEKIRQLYVALTRAKKHLYLPVFLHPKLKKAKLKELSLIEVYLHSIFSPKNLNSPDKQVILDLDPDKLKECFSDHFSIDLMSIEKIEQCEVLNQLEHSAQKGSRNLNVPKQLELVKNIPTLSYSSIKRAQSLSSQHLEERESLPSPSPLCKPDLLNEIPGGTETGIILHKILEKTSFKNLISFSSDEIYEKLVKTHIEFSNCAPHAEAITYLLALLKKQSFQSSYSTFSLGEIDENLILREAEFLFFENKTDCFIHGFYDLCFEHEGYYYLLDWKSDRLENSSSYREDHLRAHILNSYSLQISLYSRAIELFCQSNNTDPKFGGIFYVYLRGLSQQAGLCYFSTEDISQISDYQKDIKEAMNANS